MRGLWFTINGGVLGLLSIANVMESRDVKYAAYERFHTNRFI